MCGGGDVWGEWGSMCVGGRGAAKSFPPFRVDPY